MTREKFESTIGYHCFAVLMGLKPSNLVSFSKTQVPMFPEYVEEYSEKLSQEGLKLEIICACRKHYLLLVYRPEQLQEYLSKKEAQEILRQDGYPENASLQELLMYLKKRLEERTEFPHEIGLFLGYPLDDVKGFQKYKGSECKMCGYWKVYGDVETARHTFAQFDRCRTFIQEQLQAGYTLTQVLQMKYLCMDGMKVRQ